MDLFDPLTAKPVTFTWVIGDFFECTRYSKKMSSPETKLSFGAFNLDLLRLGSGNVYISFVKRDNIPEFYYRISLIDKEGRKRYTKEGRATNFNCTFSGELLRDEKYGQFLPDGKLTIHCEIFEISYVKCIQNRLDNLVSLSQDNQSLLDSGKLSDVVLVVGEREFKAHKVILSARSVVFEKMFEHGLEDSKRNRVVIEDMSSAAAEELLKFIYTGKVKFLGRHVHELYAAAYKYQIDSLKSHCALYLSMSLSVSTVPKVLQLAELYSLEDLKSKCIDYITRHSTEFKFDDWKELTTTRPELVFQVFQILGKKQVK